MPIIKSILDTDLYKFTMQQAVQKYFPEAIAQYELFVRTPVWFRRNFKRRLNKEIRELSKLSLTNDEFVWLQDHCPYLGNKFLDQLSAYRFNPKQVKIKQENGKLRVLVKGPWQEAILWEVPLMAIISELYCKQSFNIDNVYNIVSLMQTFEKRVYLKYLDVPIIDMGTRRRFSYSHHDKVLETLTRMRILAHKIDFKPIDATSNVHLAMKYNISAVGTMAHEWIMGVAASLPSSVRYKDANQVAIGMWWSMYDDYPEMLTALTDTFTSQSFFRQLTQDNQELLKCYPSVRHDSGDPIAFIDMACEAYKQLGIDPMTKRIVFSDGLNVEKVKRIHDSCNGRIQDSYGIGTNLTNDIHGVTPLNMVIKLTKINFGNGWVPTVKLSDDPGKALGTEEEIKRCKRQLSL